VSIEGQFSGGSEICTGFAERQVRAEKVAARAADEFQRFLAADAPVDIRLADFLDTSIRIDEVDGYIVNRVRVVGRRKAINLTDNIGA